jgi:8-oxo-dGTP diphosphatase
MASMSKTITYIDIYGKGYEVPIDELRWRPSVYGIVINDGEILLSKQFGDKYDLPGGGLELGEEPEAAVIREIKEETGLDAKNPRLVALKNSFFMTAHAENKPYHCLLIYYVCDLVGGEISTDGFDEWEKQYASPAEWLDLIQLDGIKVASSVDYRPIVKKALK